MSRSRKPHGRPALPAESATDAAAPIALPQPALSQPAPARPAPPSPALRPITARQRLALILASIATALWILALALMTVLTSNPALLSHDQLLRSDAVVIGHPVAGAPDRLRIERVLAGDLTPDDEITIVNWGGVAAHPAGPAYLVPLTRVRQNYAVTVLDGQRVAPLIYPAVPETIGEVKQILERPER